MGFFIGVSISNMSYKLTRCCKRSLAKLTMMWFGSYRVKGNNIDTNLFKGHSIYFCFRQVWCVTKYLLETNRPYLYGCLRDFAMKPMFWSLSHKRSICVVSLRNGISYAEKEDNALELCNYSSCTCVLALPRKIKFRILKRCCCKSYTIIQKLKQFWPIA